ncbi:MAG: hypothetical protein JWO38_6179 [Gemmataceae bacterium]|nr:hypothetical protein [Gemmataceae bacterium]
MSDRDALLAAILAAPDDDLPRLVYADWLDENGRAIPPPERRTAADRAAFIRAQIEAARAEPFSPAARAARERADRLLNLHREEWTWHLRGTIEGAEFVRGFVEHVTVDLRRFPQVADAIFDAEPVRSVRVPRPSPQAGDGWLEEWSSLESVFEVARLRQITTLELPAVFLQEYECDVLAGSPYLDGLTHLSLRENPIQPGWLSDFLAGPRLPHLTGLDLSEIANLGPGLAAGLARADHRRFHRFDISGVTFLSDVLKRALGSPCLEEVEELRLGWRGYPETPGPLTYLDLGWVIPWGRLRVLDLAGQGLGPDGVREVAWNPAAAGLRWLGLAANGLGPEGARLLASAPHLNLFYLDVRRNSLGPKDVDALRRRFPDAEVEG